MKRMVIQKALKLGLGVNEQRNHGKTTIPTHALFIHLAMNQKK